MSASFSGGLNKRLSLQFGDGLICHGQYQGTATEAEKTVPISCSDGSTGTAKMKATNNVGIVSFRLQNGASGTVRLEKGKELTHTVSKMSPSLTEKKDSREEVDDVFLETCRSSNVSGKAILALRMRLNGLSRSQASAQLSTAKPGTVGYVIREAALDAAFDSETTSAKRASLMGLAFCLERFRQAG